MMIMVDQPVLTSLFFPRLLGRRLRYYFIKNTLGQIANGPPSSSPFSPPSPAWFGWAERSYLYSLSPVPATSSSRPTRPTPRRRRPSPPRSHGVPLQNPYSLPHHYSHFLPAARLRSRPNKRVTIVSSCRTIAIVLFSGPNHSSTNIVSTAITNTWNDSYMIAE